jgi:hypothetical protein
VSAASGSSTCWQRPAMSCRVVPAALSFIMTLGPRQARQALERHALAVREVLETCSACSRARTVRCRRACTLIETAYLRAMTKAELDWLCSVIDELRSGTLSWSYEELAEAARPFLD